MEIIRQDCKRAVATLSNLSNEELDTYMNSDEKLCDILKNLDKFYLKELESEKETLMASIKSLAEYNLAKEPQLIEGRERIETLSQEGEEQTRAVEEKTKTLRAKTGDMTPETALALLQTAASEMEEESDAIAQKFLDNEIELDEFLEQFSIKRKLMHLRLVKAEKLAKLLSRDPLLSGAPNYVNTPPMNINSSYFPGIPQPSGTVPYPTGPLNMPMPGGMSYFQNHY